LSPIRQRWLTTAITVGTLLLVALFAAKGTTEVLANWLLPIDEVQVVAGPRETEHSAVERTDRNPETVFCRNVFDPESGGLCTEEGACESDSDCAESQTCTASVCTDNVGCGGNEDCDGAMVCVDGTCIPDPDAEQDYPTCTGAVRLVGTMVFPRRRQQSYASISAASGTPLLYREGGRVEEWQVRSIEPHRVLMQPGAGSLCQVAMFSDEPVVAATTPARPEPNQASVRVNPRSGSSGPSAAELDSNITRVSDTSFRINRSLLNGVLEDQGALMRTARVIPHQENGRTVGVKLYGIRRNSLLGRLGIQNGDMLRQINGFNMSEPDEALRAYTRLRNSENLTVSLVRRGQPVNIEYTVQ